MDDLEIRRRRAIYRAKHRGTKELDIFEQFLVLPEPQLFDWIMKGAPVNDTGFAALVAEVRRVGGFD